MPRRTVDLRVLGVNDLHGNLEPLRDEDGRVVGGLAYLDAHLDAYEKERPGRTIRVHAGDMVGGSPFVSGRYRDEPTVLAMNEMGFDVGTPGNHEFDGGEEEMLRLVNGGRGDGAVPAFAGAGFPYVAANVERVGNGENVFPPYAVLERGGVRVGFVGVTTLETPEGLMPEAAAPFRFGDISEAVNEAVTRLRGEGVEAIVVLAHAGGTPGGAGVARGEIFSEAAQMSDEVDAVVAGHTHTRLDEAVGNKLVVQGGEYGKAFSILDLTVDRRTGDVTRSRAEVVETSHDVRPTTDLSALVDRYRAKAAPVSGRVIATAANDATRRPGDPSGGSAVGNLVADGRRSFAGADLAFVNSSGLRADIEAGPVTYGEAFAVQPFGDDLVRMRLSGAAVLRALEEQRTGARSRTLQASGLSYALDPSRPDGRRVTEAVLRETGEPIDPQGSYTVAVDAFLAAGGDGFEAFEEGTDRSVVGKDIDALASHLGRLPQPFAPAGPGKKQGSSG